MIGQMVQKWQPFFEIQDGGIGSAAILKSTLSVEPPSQEMNSLFVIFNQKCNLYWGILTFKGSLLSGL